MIETEITQVIYWADNSIEVYGVDPATNKEISHQLIAPHGDRCF